MVHLIGREVGNTGFGLMSLTPIFGKSTPREQAFATLNAALETGAYFWNAGQFYGTPEYNSLHLLHEYFVKYPEKAEKVVLSVKGGLTSEKIPDGSEAFVRQSVEECLELLPPSVKKIDIFQCARVDPNVPIETTMSALKNLAAEGKFERVGLSEVKAETIRRANAVIPIAAVEVEFSLFETSILTNGVASTCAELDIPIVAYSPLGRGVLTGQVTRSEDIAQSSYLRLMDRFQGENLEHNLRLIHELNKLSSEFHPYTMGNIALSWLRAQSGKDGLPVILPICGSSKEANVRANAVHVELKDDDIARIDKVLRENEIVGDRAYAAHRKYLEG